MVCVCCRRLSILFFWNTHNGNAESGGALSLEMWYLEFCRCALTRNAAYIYFSNHYQQECSICVPACKFLVVLHILLLDNIKTDWGEVG
jgi:hypothetical protein